MPWSAEWYIEAFIECEKNYLSTQVLAHSSSEASTSGRG